MRAQSVRMWSKVAHRVEPCQEVKRPNTGCGRIRWHPVLAFATPAGVKQSGGDTPRAPCPAVRTSTTPARRPGWNDWERYPPSGSTYPPRFVTRSFKSSVSVEHQFLGIYAKQLGNSLNYCFPLLQKYPATRLNVVQLASTEYRDDWHLTWPATSKSPMTRLTRWLGNGRTKNWSCSEERSENTAPTG